MKKNGLKIGGFLLALLAAVFAGREFKPCQFTGGCPEPRPTPVETPAPTEEPIATPTATQEATATSTEPTATVTASKPAPEDPYLSLWKVVVPDGTTKTAAAFCSHLNKLPDGTFLCYKDTTCFYETNDPEGRWPSCRPLAVPACDADHWSDPCMKATCSGGAPGAEPTYWCERACPDGPAFDAKGSPAGCLISWKHKPGEWGVTLRAKAGCTVVVTACPCGGYSFRRKGNACGVGSARF